MRKLREFIVFPNLVQKIKQKEEKRSGLVKNISFRIMRKKIIQEWKKSVVEERGSK